MSGSGSRCGCPARHGLTWADANQMENALLSLVVNLRDQLPDAGVLSIVVSNVQLDDVFVAAHPAVPPGDYIQVAVSGPAETKQWQQSDDLTGVDLFMARAFVREAGGCLLRSGPEKDGLSLRLFSAAPYPAPGSERGGRTGARRAGVRRADEDIGGGGRRGDPRNERRDAACAGIRHPRSARCDGGVPADRRRRRNRPAVHRSGAAGRRQRTRPG